MLRFWDKSVILYSKIKKEKIKVRKKLIKNVFCTVIALGMIPAFTGCGGKEKTVNSGNGEAPAVERHIRSAKLRRMGDFYYFVPQGF